MGAPHLLKGRESRASEAVSRSPGIMVCAWRCVTHLVIPLGDELEGWPGRKRTSARMASRALGCPSIR